MGAGASAGVAAAAEAMGEKDMLELVSGLGEGARARLRSSLATSDSAAEVAADGVEAVGLAVASAKEAAAPANEAAAGGAEAVGSAVASAEEVAAPANEARLELSFVIDELFRCFDADQDGAIGKDEYLECCDKIADILDESFGPKQRKQKMKWYKDAGAEGDPAEGMYLTKNKWKDALVKSAQEESQIPAEEPQQLAAWLWDKYARRLVELCFPAPKAEAEAGVPGLPAGAPPSYPVTIPLTELATKLEEAKSWGRRPLVLAGHCSEVDTFFKYYKIPDALTVESSSVFLKKKSEIRALLSSAMDYQGLCAPVLLKMAGGSFDWSSFCCEDFPAEIFCAALWTPAAAFDAGFISQGMRDKLDCDPERWKDFHVIVSSDLSLEEATAKLADKIPHYNRLAVIAVDPASIAKG